MTEAYRLNYPLTQESLVLDVGCYQGSFTRAVWEHYGCWVMAFEPVPEFFESLPATWRRPSKQAPWLFDFGLGARTEPVTISVRGDSSSVHRPVDEHQRTVGTLIMDVVDVFKKLEITKVDLMKINIEGGEYQLLDRMLETGLVERVKHFQIQFHDFGAGPDGAVSHRERIRQRLALTHDEQWCVGPFVWESWAQR